MPLRNYHILLLVVVVSVLCHITARRTHSALIVGDAIDKIEKYYVDPVDHRQLLESAMKGLQTELDEHSQFIPPESFAQFEQSLAQEFAGIGVLVEQPEPNTPVRVITPLVGSPALRAGVLPGDRILKVDGEDVSTSTLREVSDRLGGVIGTEVKIVILRDDSEHVTLQVMREQIPLDSVLGDYRDEDSQWVYRVRNHPRIAMIRCTSFGEKTAAEMERALRTLDNDFDALILDLRGNPGGLLNAAVAVCDMFIEEGEIVSTRGRDRDHKATSEQATAGTLVEPQIPMAILIDGNSASASEIVSSCLQDHQRAAIVGTRSFGKGTVQQVMMLEYGRSAFKLTTARYYRPSGANIHRTPEAKDEDVWGVTPDPGLEVELSDEDRKAISKRWRRATYPVWEDREITWQADRDEPDPAPELDLEFGTVPEPGATPEPDSGNDASDNSAEENKRSDSDATQDSNAEEQEQNIEDGSFDDPTLDPQLWRAMEYLQQQIDDRKPTSRAA
ncbi:S41 family peptidase [Roseimaritima ulvae]|uniref:Putative CtpA-like serine protease n=1 Tax=Roseimaritima ulvae TaxID=980254 RepID=A0A5B9R3Q9_9BACT|nr:S41 family peptidase [Roseimaritima ulvae]QEG40991.1 putative CtpA-like serine protease [Roseimaritima ulvae]